MPSQQERNPLQVPPAATAGRAGVRAAAAVARARVSNSSFFFRFIERLLLGFLQGQDRLVQTVPVALWQQVLQQGPLGSGTQTW
jgi:hypothetical protein